jgi:ribosomal protein S1
MTADKPDWGDMAHMVAVGDRLKAKVLRVDRWGLLVDLGLPFDGFIDRLNVGNELESFYPGLELDVVVVQLAEYNHQIRVHLFDSTEPSGSGLL